MENHVPDGVIPEKGKPSARRHIKLLTYVSWGRRRIR
jgi:hypothetical protein